MGTCSCTNKFKNEPEEVAITQQKTNPSSSYVKIVKIQALYRGYLARKHMNKVKAEIYYREVEIYNHRVYDQLKKHAQAFFSSRKKKIVSFVYDVESDEADPSFSQRVFKAAQKTPDNGTYIGEWYY